jgi:hypothetical protein
VKVQGWREKQRGEVAPASNGYTQSERENPSIQFLVKPCLKRGVGKARLSFVFRPMNLKSSSTWKRSFVAVSVDGVTVFFQCQVFLPFMEE